MNDDDFLEKLKREWAEQNRFFSNAGKEERECWTVRALLTALNITFDAKEVQSLPQDDDGDVVFRSARLQVKEIVAPNERRQRDIAAASRRAQSAKTPLETAAPGVVYDTPPVTDGTELIREQARHLAYDPRYLAGKGKLDLLFYVTRTFVSTPKPPDDVRTLAAFGWRSISCLYGDRAFVHFANGDAPDFLRAAAAVTPTG